MTEQTRYTRTAAILHWVVAALIITVYFLGRNFHEISAQYPDPSTAPPEVFALASQLFMFHESFGIIVLLLVCWRIAWRWKNAPPELPPSFAKWNRVIALWVHRLLYACMLIMPLSGLGSGLLGGFGALFFGLQIPAIAESEAIAGVLGQVHGITSGIILNVVILHLLAVGYHLVRSFVSDHPNVLARMSPFGRAAPQESRAD